MPVGELAAVSNAAFWALVGTIAKSMPISVRPIHVTSSHPWTTVVILVVILVALGKLTDLTTMDRDTFLLFVGSGLVNSAGSITFWVANSRSQISKVFPTTQGLFILLTLISSTIFFNTSLGIGLVGGALLVVSGVILINWKRDDTSESSQDLRGTLILIGMMLATAIFWVVGLLTTVEGLKNTEPIIARIIRNGIRVIIYLVIAIVYPRMGYKKAVSVSPAKMLAGGLFFTLASFIVRVCSRQHLSDRRSCTNEYFSAVGGNARADIPQRKDGTSVRDGHDPLCRRNHHSGSNQVTDAKSRRSQCS